MIQPEGSSVTFLAGLYRIEELKGIQIPVFTVLTRDPVESIRFIHDRMPMILPKDSIREWIQPEAKPERIIKSAIQDLIFDKAG